MINRRIGAALALALCVTFASGAVANSQPVDPPPPQAPGAETLPPLPDSILPESEAPPTDDDSNTIVVQKPAVEITDPAEAQRRGDQVLQANAEQNPSARADPVNQGCTNDRFNSCKIYIGPVEVYTRFEGVTSFTGSYDVYMTLTTRSEVKNVKSTIRLTTWATVTRGVPPVGTFRFALAAQRWNKLDPYTFPDVFSNVLAPNSTGSKQWSDWSPVTTVSLGATTYIYQWEAWVAGAKYEGLLPGPQYANQKIRCDNATPVNNGTGCVNPSFEPTVKYYSSAMPYIVDNIRAGQAATGDGDPATGQLLEREFGDFIKENRDDACGTTALARLRKIAATPPPNMTSPSCDEYPFASTVQGGTGATVAWVPLAENTAQGTLMAQFYRDYRVMPSDGYLVDATS